MFCHLWRVSGMPPPWMLREARRRAARVVFRGAGRAAGSRVGSGKGWVKEGGGRPPEKVSSVPTGGGGLGLG